MIMPMLVVFFMFVFLGAIVGAFFIVEGANDHNFLYAFIGVVIDMFTIVIALLGLWGGSHLFAYPYRVQADKIHQQVVVKQTTLQKLFNRMDTQVNDVNAYQKSQSRYYQIVAQQQQINQKYHYLYRKAENITFHLSFPKRPRVSKHELRTQIQQTQSQLQKLLGQLPHQTGVTYRITQVKYYRLLQQKFKLTQQLRNLN